MIDYMFFAGPGSTFENSGFGENSGFLKSRFSGFLAFSGLEIFHVTILVKNQYVQLRFRLLGTRWGRVMTDFTLFLGRGPFSLARLLPMGTIPPFPENPSHGPWTGKNLNSLARAKIQNKIP